MLTCIDYLLFISFYKVFTTDISKQLMEYGVEYHVLQEELSSPSPESKKIKHLEEMNKTLMQQNKILHEQLEVNMCDFSLISEKKISTVYFCYYSVQNGICIGCLK